ncbi:hypothetical protein LEN26_016249 [Aphanomyces euteiches]|nr:hypothetical protein LEN26_016249 [Aphanomyces euteiches]
MQFTPQQLIGAGRYSATTRIGNWNEDLMLEEARMKDYRAHKQTGGLSLAHRRKMERSNSRVPLSYWEDGLVRYNSYIALEHVQTSGCLACDLWEETYSGSGEFVVSVARRPSNPSARTTFCIVGPSGKQAGVIKYGEPFRLMANEALRVDEVSNTPLPPLYLKSVLKNERYMSPVSSNQSVFLSTAVDNSTLWIATHGDLGGAEKLLATTTPISAHDNIGLVHKMTGVFLHADAKFVVATDFGAETEVCCATAKAFGKSFNLKHERDGARTSDTHAKETLSPNLWRLTLATSPDAAVECRNLPAASTPEAVLDLMVQSLSRSSVWNVRALVQTLEASNANGLIEREDLKWTIKGLEGSKPLRGDQYDLLLDVFDEGRKGYVRINRFVDALRSGALSTARKALLDDTYNGLVGAFGDVTLTVLRQAYDAGCEAPFQSTTRINFWSLWPTQDPAGLISRQEFVNVYKDVSRAIQDDSMFDQLLKNAWGV